MHILLFEFHGGMYVSVQGNVYSGVSKNLAQALDIKAEFNTACGKCVSQCMEIHRNQTTLFLYIMEIFLHGAGFDVFFIYSGKDISLSVGKFLLNELDQTVWNWNCTDRTFAFG